MAFWESKLIKELGTIIRINVTKFSKIIRTLNEENQQQWIDTLKEEINESCTLLIEEATFFVAIQYLRKNCLKLCELLQIEMLPYEAEKLTLYEEKKLLERRLKEYEDEIVNRQHKLQEMTAKQMELCRILEKVPVTFVENSIPTSTELENLSFQIRKLEIEKQEIKEEFVKIKSQIINTLQELNLQICPKIEEIILSSDNSSSLISRENLQCLIVYYKELRKKQNEEEYEQLESLRNVINNLYNTCHVAKRERKITQNIHQYELDAIQTEISTLKNYWQTNENIFSLLDKYNLQWAKLVKFIEENQRINKHEVTRLCKQIYQIENRLIEAVVKFEENNRKPFTTFGSTIPEVIAQLHDTFGKYAITEMNIIKTLSAIINEGEEQCSLSSEKVIPSQSPINENSNILLKQTAKDFRIIPNHIQTSGSSPSRDEESSSASQKSLNEGQQNSDLNLSHNIKVTEGEIINAKINMPENSVWVNNTAVVSNTSLKTKKLKTYAVYKKGKRYLHSGKPKQTHEVESSTIFKPKAVDFIRHLFKELELK